MRQQTTRGSVKVEQEGAGWVVRVEGGTQRFHCATEQMAQQLSRVLERAGAARR